MSAGRRPHACAFVQAAEAARRAEVAAAVEANKTAKLKPTTKTSKLLGVSWNEGKQKWRARLRVAGKMEHLGYFDDEEAAGLAVDARLRAVGRESDVNFRGTDAAGRPIFVGQPATRTSEYIGVSFGKARCKWSARITVPGEKQRSIGSAFESAEAAARAYDEIARAHGMPTNFDEDGERIAY
jgi:hypothetical protein